MNLCWRKILVSPVFTFFFCRSFSYIQDILKWTLANKSIHNIISENFLQRKGPIECGWGYDNQNAFKKFLNRPEFSLFCFAHPLAATLAFSQSMSHSYFDDLKSQGVGPTLRRHHRLDGHARSWLHEDVPPLQVAGQGRLTTKCFLSSSNHYRKLIAAVWWSRGRLMLASVAQVTFFRKLFIFFVE